jgi:hypothetical protein
MNDLTNKLTLLNGFRAELGQVALKTWVSDEIAIDAAIAKAQEMVATRNDTRKAEAAKMLERLNYYLNIMGSKEVKVWHGTLDELAKRISQAKRDHRDMIDAEKKAVKSTPAMKRHVEENLKGHKALKGKLATKVAKAKEKATIKNQPVAELGLLPRIAADLGINPKVARAKLRKQFGAAWRNMNEKDIRKALS